MPIHAWTTGDACTRYGRMLASTAYTEVIAKQLQRDFWHGSASLPAMVSGLRRGAQVMLFCAAATQGMTLALGCALADAFPRLRKQTVRDVPLAYALSFAVAVATAALWVLFRGRDWAWMLQDALGVTLIMLFIRSIQLPSLKARLLVKCCT